ncbi:hypothetical protein ACN38_g2020 [Penicillium nordicum]|uniref:Uncharacterized protein n=1 Tax=Penicillium nordicum TaxID=229535 RepID=A0A0M8P7Y5_9EURO|nr:hypothetical protein ACN38_g2020 [Penicillium nordicum]
MRFRYTEMSTPKPFCKNFRRRCSEPGKCGAFCGVLAPGEIAAFSKYGLSLSSPGHLVPLRDEIGKI